MKLFRIQFLPDEVPHELTLFQIGLLREAVISRLAYRLQLNEYITFSNIVLWRIR